MHRGVTGWYHFKKMANSLIHPDSSDLTVTVIVKVEKQLPPRSFHIREKTGVRFQGLLRIWRG